MSPLLLLIPAAAAAYYLTKGGSSPEQQTVTAEAGQVWSLVFDTSSPVTRAEWEQAMPALGLFGSVMGVTGGGTRYVVTIRLARRVVLRIPRKLRVGSNTLTLAAASRAPVA